MINLFEKTWSAHTLSENTHGRQIWFARARNPKICRPTWEKHLLVPNHASDGDTAPAQTGHGAAGNALPPRPILDGYRPRAGIIRGTVPVAERLESPETGPSIGLRLPGAVDGRGDGPDPGGDGLLQSGGEHRLLISGRGGPEPRGRGLCLWGWRSARPSREEESPGTAERSDRPSPGRGGRTRDGGWCGRRQARKRPCGASRGDGLCPCRAGARTRTRLW